MTGRCLKKLIGGDLHLLFEYNKVVRGHSKNVRQAKMQSTAAAQKFINNKNAALWLQLLLYANFNVKNACFCTFTFNEENLPVNRKMAHQYFTSFIRSMRRQWKKNGRAFPYIYTLEGASLSDCPNAMAVNDINWEIRPWEVTAKWESLDQKPKKSSKKEYVARYHIHCILILSREDRKIAKEKWPYGISFINPISRKYQKSFVNLSYYMTKESRNGVLMSGKRSYIPSKNLQQPITTEEWLEPHEAIQVPYGAERIDGSCSDTPYNSHRFLTYLYQDQKPAKSYKSRGRL